MRNRSYNEMAMLQTFEERFEYLKLSGQAGAITFGYDRYLNQNLYRSEEWHQTRYKVIVRDNGCDLGVSGHEIEDIDCLNKRVWSAKIIVHHINPLTVDDILSHSEKLFDMNNLITVTIQTHNAIHYGDSNYLIRQTITERRPNDTCPWK